jgi:hypothetical protein
MAAGVVPAGAATAEQLEDCAHLLNGLRVAAGPKLLLLRRLKASAVLEH